MSFKWTECQQSRAFFSGAKLGANKLFAPFFVSEANLSGAEPGAIRWADKNQWPAPDQYKDTKNIPAELKKQLRLA